MECGQAPDLFWRLTLREIGVVMDGVAGRLRREHNERAWLAWHVEALARTKKLPKLKTLLHGERRARPKAQDWEDHLAIALQWTAVLTQKTNSQRPS